MNCKFCQSSRTMKYGFKAGTQYYKCNDCKRKFAGRDSPEGMRFPTVTIGEALGMFYDGLSVAGISRHLIATGGIYVDPATIWRWVIKYSSKADEILNRYKLKTSWRWVIDETVVKVGGQKLWLWDVIEAKSRFLLAARLTLKRNMRSATAVLSEANGRTIGIPKQIVSDGMMAYPDAIESVFGADSTNIRAKGLTDEVNKNVIERFQGTLRKRREVMQGLKTMESAEIISKGFIIHYNFLRPHTTFKGKAPAVVAGLKPSFKTWIELVEYLSRDGKTP